MYSDNEKVVLCGASAYEQKYYFNQDFASLPQSVQDELHVMCVMFTVEIGGIFTMWFDSDGSLQFETEAVDADAMYDEIGGALRIKQYQEEKKELLESLELYYRVFFLDEEVPEEALMEEDGEKIRNLLKFNDRQFTVIRRGSMESTMTFEKGKKHRSLYRTPFGNLEIGTFATRLLILKSDEKIRIEADYDLELNGSHAAENCIAITIQSVKKA